MPTTAKNFVALSASALTGSGYATAGVALALTGSQAQSYKTGGLATVLDQFTVDLARAGYTKNGCVILTLAISTPVTIDLTDLTAQAVRAGDTAFASWKEIIFTNTGSNPVAVSPGASNPLTTPLGGTSPTQTIVAGEQTRWVRPAGVTVDSTHKALKFDPGAAACTIAVCVGGS